MTVFIYFFFLVFFLFLNYTHRKKKEKKMTSKWYLCILCDDDEITSKYFPFNFNPLLELNGKYYFEISKAYADNSSPHDIFIIDGFKMKKCFLQQQQFDECMNQRIMLKTSPQIISKIIDNVMDPETNADLPTALRDELYDHINMAIKRERQNGATTKQLLRVMGLLHLLKSSYTNFNIKLRTIMAIYIKNKLLPVFDSDEYLHSAHPSVQKAKTYYTLIENGALDCYLCRLEKNIIILTQPRPETHEIHITGTIKKEDFWNAVQCPLERVREVLRYHSDEKCDYDLN